MMMMDDDEDDDEDDVVDEDDDEYDHLKRLKFSPSSFNLKLGLPTRLLCLPTASSQTYMQYICNKVEAESAENM